MLSDRRGKGLAAHSLNPSFFFLHVNVSLECSGAWCQAVRWVGEKGGARGQPGAGVTGTAVDG